MKKMSFTRRPGGSRTFANDGERKVADILLAIPAIPVENYTLDGKPRVEDVEELLNEDISEGQRDQAFAQYQQELEDRAAAEAETESEVAGTSPETAQDESHDEVS